MLRRVAFLTTWRLVMTMAEPLIITITPEPASSVTSVEPGSMLLYAEICTTLGVTS